MICSKGRVANGLSPGVDEQSEYFDATENPREKKHHEADDEDSGVDNASQILRETSVSRFEPQGREFTFRVPC